MSVFRIVFGRHCALLELSRNKLLERLDVECILGLETSEILSQLGWVCGQYGVTKDGTR